MAQEIKIWGHGGEGKKMSLKPDGEHAMVQVREALARYLPGRVAQENAPRNVPTKACLHPTYWHWTAYVFVVRWMLLTEACMDKLQGRLIFNVLYSHFSMYSNISCSCPFQGKASEWLNMFPASDSSFLMSSRMKMSRIEWRERERESKDGKHPTSIGIHLLFLLLFACFPFSALPHRPAASRPPLSALVPCA